jgi:hypothetical protein
LQTIFDPFRLWLTELTINLDVKSDSMLPRSDVLEKVNIVEFTFTLSAFLMVDESVRVILSPEIKITFHVRKVPFVLHVTSSSSPMLHTAALGDGDTTMVPT